MLFRPRRCAQRSSNDSFVHSSCTVCTNDGTFGPGGDFSKSFTIRRKLVDVTGIEPVTPCLQSRCSPS